VVGRVGFGFVVVIVRVGGVARGLWGSGTRGY
jgi:hypothetical protein